MYSKQLCEWIGISWDFKGSALIDQTSILTNRHSELMKNLVMPFVAVVNILVADPLCDGYRSHEYGRFDELWVVLTGICRRAWRLYLIMRILRLASRFDSWCFPSRDRASLLLSARLDTAEYTSQLFLILPISMTPLVEERNELHSQQGFGDCRAVLCACKHWCYARQDLESHSVTRPRRLNSPQPLGSRFNTIDEQSAITS